MATIPATSSTTSKSNSSGIPRSINDLDLNSFLTLMIKELQNQDPLNPLDNKDMLAQISQIRQVGATDKLTSTLDSVLLGQNIASSTNLIGADITAISDDGQNVEGVVSRVSIQDGAPKLHVDRTLSAKAATGDGEVGAGKYNYRVIWQDDSGHLFGTELSGDKAVTTTGKEGVDQSIAINNLPVTAGPKQIYRSDASGHEPYRLVGTIVDGSQGTFIDGLSDEQRSETQLTQWSQVNRSTNISRSYEVSLKNVATIRPPAAG